MYSTVYNFTKYTSKFFYYTNLTFIRPSTMPSSAASNPTNKNSSASISEPIEHFDSLDQNYTPEEYLQCIKACNTFSLGLQPTTDHE